MYIYVEVKYMGAKDGKREMEAHCFRSLTYLCKFVQYHVKID